MSEFSPIRGGNEGCGACDDDKQDKPPVAPPAGHNCPHCARRRVSEANRPQCGRLLGRRCAGRYGVLRCIKSGVKIPAVLSPLRSQSPNSYCYNEKIGVTHGSGPA